VNRNLDLRDFIEKHRALDVEIQRSSDGFLSDWNGSHPFVEQFLGRALIDGSFNQPHSRYIYYNERPEIIEGISRFHSQIEALSLSPRNIMAGPGSSSFLASFSLWLLQKRYAEVYYIPPLYYTFHFFLRTLGIRLRPVSGKHSFESHAPLNLPRKRTVLLLTDPVWFAGKRLRQSLIEKLAHWQKETKSLIFVDGSFQYMQWDSTRREHSSALAPESTFRLVCPTKALAIPSARFAYLLHPHRFHDDLLFLYENLVGGVAAADLAFARRALDVLRDPLGNRPLTEFLQATYRALSDQKFLRTAIIPDCGYFIFAKPSRKMGFKVAMGQEFFELKGYPGYVRVNLMIAHSALDPKSTAPPRARGAVGKLR
jgi:aspartate/methionine/tyrosine aminotransferase